MNGFKTHFLQNGRRTDISVSPLDNNCFGIRLESTGMDEGLDPTKETHAAMHAPDLIVQHTKNGQWMIMDQGTFELNDEDLQALGRAIEENLLT